MFSPKFYPQIRVNCLFAMCGIIVWISTAVFRLRGMVAELFAEYSIGFRLLSFQKNEALGQSDKPNRPKLGWATIATTVNHFETSWSRFREFRRRNEPNFGWILKSDSFIWCDPFTVHESLWNIENRWRCSRSISWNMWGLPVGWSFATPGTEWLSPGFGAVKENGSFVKIWPKNTTAFRSDWAS